MVKLTLKENICVYVQLSFSLSYYIYLKSHKRQNWISIVDLPHYVISHVLISSQLKITAHRYKPPNATKFLRTNVLRDKRTKGTKVLKGHLLSKTYKDF